MAVYYLLSSSISIPPILLAKVLYRSATIAPIISARILKMIGKITMDARLKISIPGMDFSNPIETPKRANKQDNFVIPEKRLVYYIQ